ncbi:MAG: hypothetical protein EAZ55_06565 [Cytophagales bacterium]|nr:MAG: hypothetical protein EAZ55_06565 [Cytophagales bacterium]
MWRKSSHQWQVPNCIALLATLKPADDIRMYHKWQSALQHYFPTTNFLLFGNQLTTPFLAGKKNVAFVAFSQQRHQWGRRLYFLFYAFYSLLRYRPDWVVVTTFEFLPFVFLYKCFKKKVRIIYDIQENYEANHRHSKGFFSTLGRLLIHYSEKWSRYFVDAYTLAEKCYEKELSFLPTNNTWVVENLFLPIVPYRPSFPASPPLQNIRLALCGTISEGYGLYRALAWVESYLHFAPLTTLHLIGHCPLRKDFQYLEQYAQKHKHCHLHISLLPMNYIELMEKMQEIDVWLMPYEVRHSVANRIPTKFYEAMYYQKYIWVEKNHFWIDFLHSLQYTKVSHLSFFEQNSTCPTLSDASDYKMPESCFWRANLLAPIIDYLQGFVIKR